MHRLLVLAALLSTAALAQPAVVSQYLLRIEPVRSGFTLQNMSEEELRIVTEHAQYLKSLLDQGKLRLAGQAFDPKGLWGIVIVSATDSESALALLNGDPGVKAKIFRGEAIPFRTVFEKRPDPALK